MALLCTCLLSLTACGGGSSKSAQGHAQGGVVRNVDPVPDESMQDVLDRIRGASTASSCEAVKGLLHSTYGGDISSTACRAVKAEIDGFLDPKGKAWKTGAAIGYRTAIGRTRLAALVLDADRTYRIAYVQDVSALPVPARPAAFDRNARAVVLALRSGDCDAFLRLVSRTMGLGVGSDEEVCRRVSDVPFRRELLANAQARPVPLGGDSAVAFYKLRTRPDAYYTLVMAREDTKAGGQSRYVLVNAFPAD